MPRGGKRKNQTGRPKGALAQKTLEKIAVLSAFRQRVMRHADDLFNAQYAKAVGSIQVFRIDEEEDANGKVKRVHTLVTDAGEIKRVLDEGEGCDAIVGKSYYFVTEIPPDNKAIDSLFDRTFGKAQQSVEITDETSQKWKQAVQQLIESQAAKNAKEAVELLETAGYSAPSEIIRDEVYLGDVG